MTATDELRRLLDERGVEYDVDDTQVDGNGTMEAPLLRGHVGGRLREFRAEDEKRRMQHGEEHRSPVARSRKAA